MAQPTLRDILSALVEAARRTLRGEPPPPPRPEQFPKTRAWLTNAAAALDALEITLRDANVDSSRVALHIEGHDTSLRRALDAIQFHVREEFPALLTRSRSYASLGIRATNLNDRYTVLRFEQHETLPSTVRTALRALADVLSQQPSENT